MPTTTTTSYVYTLLEEEGKAVGCIAEYMSDIVTLMICCCVNMMFLHICIMECDYTQTLVLFNHHVNKIINKQTYVAKSSSSHLFPHCINCSRVF